MPPFAHAMDTPLLLISTALFILLLALGERTRQRGRRRLPLPPGPKGLPLIGNVLDMPKLVLAKEYLKLSDAYGECPHDIHPLRYPLTTSDPGSDQATSCI